LRSRRLFGFTLVALVAPVPPLRAQRLSVVEAGVGTALVLARHRMAAVEVGVGYRPGGQTRVAFAVDAGRCLAGCRCAVRMRSRLASMLVRSGAVMVGLPVPRIDGVVSCSAGQLLSVACISQTSTSAASVAVTRCPPVA